MFDPNDEFPASPEALSRREVVRLLTLSPLALAFFGDTGALAATAEARRVSEKLEPGAGQWQTWLTPSVVGLRPQAPPRRGSSKEGRELRQLRKLQAERTDATRALVQFWDAQGGLQVWSHVLLEKIKENGTNPVLASRALALFHTAIADTTIAVWNAKYAFRRWAPSRRSTSIRSQSRVSQREFTYPSEHAAIAAAAATVLNHLFPAQTIELHGVRMTFDAAANEAASSRLWAGANYRSDLLPGILVGQAVGRMAVLRGQSDGSAAVWDSVGQPGRLTGPQHWVPTPPANAFPPLAPLAGYWDPWLLESGNQFRAPVPPALQGAFPGEGFLQECAEVKHTVDNLTPNQLKIAQFWANNPRESYTPPGEWAHRTAGLAAAAKLSTPRAARALALVSTGLADSAICCWDSKYAYWICRPITAIRTLEGQPFHQADFLTPIPTPGFPAYTSGHSTFSGCTAEVLEHLFPGGKVADAFGRQVRFSVAAEQAAVSRLYGGIHYRSDNEAGLVGGKKIGELAIRRARTDGAG